MPFALPLWLLRTPPLVTKLIYSSMTKRLSVALLGLAYPTKQILFITPQNRSLIFEVTKTTASTAMDTFKI